MPSTNAARATIPPPPSLVSRRIGRAPLSAVANDCADARASHELTAAERDRGSR